MSLGDYTTLYSFSMHIKLKHYCLKDRFSSKSTFLRMLNVLEDELLGHVVEYTILYRVGTNVFSLTF